MSSLVKLIECLNHYLWDYFLIYFIIASSLFFTFYLRFIQIRSFSLAVKELINKNESGFGISGFQALCVSLASRVGTGNIAGVALAIYYGGPGAVFWMWALAFFGMATSFVECSLAQLYKVQGQDNIFRGGPSYYMLYGLRSRFMALVFAVALIVTYAIAFNSAQSHTIACAFKHSMNLPTYVSAIFMTIVSAIVILGGIRRISTLSQWLVPFMSLAYIIVTLTIVFLNYEYVGDMLILIIRSAFGFEQATSGLMGYTVLGAMNYGGKRGLFSNEAGMGSVPNIAAAAGGKHPAIQGYLQMLGPFFDTIVICSCTAFIILLSGVLEPGSNINGIELTQKALVSQLGAFGSYFVTFILFWFVFTTIIGNYTYAEMSLVFLLPNLNQCHMMLFRAFVLLIIAIAPFLELGLVWNMADFTMGLMTLLNLIAILYLAREAKIIAQDYEGNLSCQSRTFSIERYPSLQRKISSGLWQ
jgi:AGCS family alanine or glycine:cation symporter